MIKFGTGGFRGIIGEDFTKENIQLVIQAISNIIIKKNYKREVVVGYDYRFLSPQAATWVSEVFAGNDIKVNYSCEATPSPTMIYATKISNVNYGIMITASHNPCLFNGVKIFQKGGIDADLQTTMEIEEESTLVSEIKSVSSFSDKYNELVKTCNFTDSYIEYVKKFISPKIKNNKIKILYDGFYGVGEKTITKLINDFNLENIELTNCSHDPLFGGFDPNPTKENMLLRKNDVVNGNYAYCFGMDSDGDRLGIIDENGKYVDSNEILACLYYYLVKYRGEKGDCVRNIATSILLDKVASNLGFACHEVDVGFKNISSKMKETNALIGGESSGGLTIRNYLFGKDSTFSSMLFLEMVIIMDKPVSKIVEEVKNFANYTYIIDEDIIRYDSKLDIYKCLSQNTPNFSKKTLKIEKINNNIKYYFGNNEWALLRISGTEPVIRNFIEMSNSKDVEDCKSTLKSYAEEFSKQSV